MQGLAGGAIACSASTEEPGSDNRGGAAGNAGAPGAAGTAGRSGSGAGGTGGTGDNPTGTGGAAGSNPTGTGGAAGSNPTGTGGAAGSNPTGTGGAAGNPTGTGGAAGATGGKGGTGGTVIDGGVGGADGGIADSGTREGGALDSGVVLDGSRDSGSAVDAGPDRASDSGGTADSGTRFSFFVTSLVAMRALSGSQNGFGGDLRFGQATGLAGADEICRQTAERSMAGNGKTWRAFLSTVSGSVNAIDRIGDGPWYDRNGRLVAMTKANLAMTRPTGADPSIINDLPNESGVPNHNPDGTGLVDHHDILTGSTATGTLHASGVTATCQDWTSVGTGSPAIGHSWPASSGMSWSSSHNVPSCAAGVLGGTSGQHVGSLGGYGGIYCFALTP
jgi:hypothetical protein